VPLRVPKLGADPLGHQVGQHGQYEDRRPEEPDLGLVVDPEGDEDAVGRACEEDQGDECEEGRADTRAPGIVTGAVERAGPQ
jgi:hypothetical protein